MREGQLDAGRESSIVLELCCNIDDMTGEELGFAMERLLEGGALDVYTLACGMKHSRPGILLTAICHEEDREKILEILFRDTTTLGVRENRMTRYSLSRSFRSVETEAGVIRVKTSSGYGTEKSKAEYEDLANIAKSKGISIRDALEILRKSE